MNLWQTHPLINRLRQLTHTPLYENAIYLMGITVVTSLLGFFFWILVARFYNETVVGYSSAVLAAINLMTIISLAGLNSVIVRYLAHTDKPRQLINTCLSLAGIISLLAAAIFVAGLHIWSPAIGFIAHNYIFAAAFLSFTLLATLSHMSDDTFIALRQTKFSFYRNLIFSLLKLPLPLLFLTFFHTFGIVASWGIANSIALVLALMLFLPRAQHGYLPIPTVKIVLVRDTWQYSMGNYLANLLMAAPGLLFPLMVVNILNAESNAYFYIPWMIAGTIFSVPHAVATSLFAEGSHFKERLRENTLKSVKFSFLILVPATAVLLLVGKWLLLAFGQDYVDNGLPLLQILAVSSLPLSVCRVYTSVLRVIYRIKGLILFQGLISAIALLASYFIIPSYGITGIGYVWFFTHLIAAIFVVASHGFLTYRVRR